MQHRTLMLIILDGFGYRQSPDNNACAAAHTPTLDYLWEHCPHTLLSASGLDVGLPKGQMGNSEVGHLTMGAGRVIYQDLTRIDKAIATGEFFENPVFVESCDALAKTDHTLHILGLLSPGGVHSHEDQIAALIKLAANHHVKKIAIHAFLDGRDTPPKSAKASIEKLESLCKTYPQAHIASISGRYYAMDRDKRWERTEKAYDCIVNGKAEYHADTALAGLEAAYLRGETDEFIKPCVIGKATTLQDNDVVIFMNFRSDRARQLSYALTNSDFTGFERENPPTIHLITLCEYAKNIQAKVAFPATSLQNTLGEFLQTHHLRQLRIAETEKYAHVTFFFNGGRETPYQNETRIMIPSQKVATYDLAPEMSAAGITDYIVSALEQQLYDVIICNFANADMLGHTGNFEATISAITTLDQCLASIVQALQKTGSEAIITADHGNAECMMDEHTHQPHTAHTVAEVPFIYIGRPATIIHEGGCLSDIAPTLISLLGLKIPTEMTGRPLVQVA